MDKKIITIAIIAVVAVGAGAFYGGMQYGTAKTKAAQVASRGTGFGGGAGGVRGGQRGGGANGGGFTAGQIIAKDDKSITIKTNDGGSKIVFLSGSTQVGKTVDGSVSDLDKGEQVVVGGQANPDGSLNAQNIQIRPTQPTASSAQ